MREPCRILIVSCYELGHQPLAAASAIAFLERSGFQPRAVDLSVEALPDWPEAEAPDLIAISVPMHTALRTGVSAALKLRNQAPDAHICFYGLYAVLNQTFLFDTIADSVIGGEFDATLVELAQTISTDRPLDAIPGLGLAERSANPVMARLDFPPPSRAGLPKLEHYAKVEDSEGQRTAAAVEASRGCLHSCRHCPIVPVYGGRFFIVPRDVVLNDVDQLVAAGATHLTFSDPDFLNGPKHSMAIVRAIHERYPHVTFDVTTKVEMILRHRRLLADLATFGCLFVVSAVESLSDTVLDHLDKGHTRDDVHEALALLREVA